MVISFESSPEYGPHGREHQREDLSGVSQADLRWYYFLGSFQMIRDDADISPGYKWVPLFDFFYELQDSVSFAQGGDVLAKITFTENAETIDLSLDTSGLHMKPTYTDVELVCPIPEFVASAEAFTLSELQRIISVYPSLRQNSAVAALASSVGLVIDHVDNE